ncbi:MAG: hypothetical protein Ct9H300mP25_07460 [Acidobacteriota bacterium]|nr:MAG: hypothetical protein Ct9H300mP25_07460 [Acidobacteriota bacterium]
MRQAAGMLSTQNLLVDKSINKGLFGRVYMLKLSPIPTCLSLQAVRLVASISDIYPGKRNRTSTFDPGSTGLIVRIPSPPLLMFSVTAVAIVFSHLYVMGMLTVTRELVRRSKLLGKRCGVRDGGFAARNCVH